MLNIISQHLLPKLYKNMDRAGQKWVETPVTRGFRFGGNEDVTSKTKITVPMSLGGTIFKTDVFIIPTRIPFIHGVRH